MDISKLNSLVELYFKKTEEEDGKKPFLKWLKSNKPTYNWEEVTDRIFKLTVKIKSLINEGDRCLILSENRPYWLMSDISIMNAGGISVPIFTTYSENDYEYILKDCKPSLIIVSNNDQFKKIKKFINKDIQTIISFEKIETDSFLIQDILNENTTEKIINKKLKCLIEPQKDYFGRYLGECFINNESVSAYMVRNGLAFDYPKYSKKKYSKDQIYAKNNKLGLWSMEFDYPWIWRKNNR